MEELDEAAADQVEAAAEDINRMADRELSEEEKEALLERIEEMRELLRQQGQAGAERLQRMLRFSERAHGGPPRPGGSEQRPGDGLSGRGGHRAEGSEGEQQGDGQPGASPGEASDGSEDGSGLLQRRQARRQGSEGQGSEGQGSEGQGSEGQGSEGQGSEGQGSEGQGSEGQGQGALARGETAEGQEEGQDGAGPGRGDGAGIGRGGEHDGNADGALPETQDVTAVAADTGEGPSMGEVIQGAAQRGFVGRGYEQVFTDYQTQAETVLERDEIPPGYRFYVRRYFQLIRPRE
jgi:hypothetical protein